MDEEDNNKLLIWQCCWRISQICKETLFIEWPQADNKGTASRIERQKEWGSWLICGGVYMGSQSRHKSRTELRENRGFFRKQFHMKTGRTPAKPGPFRTFSSFLTINTMSNALILDKIATHWFSCLSLTNAVPRKKFQSHAWFPRTMPL